MKYDVYDFDGTIYNGDSGIDIFLFALRRNPRIFRRVPKVLWYGLLYLLKIIKKEKFKSVVFAFIDDIYDIEYFVQDFWYTHEKKLKKFWTEN